MPPITAHRQMVSPSKPISPPPRGSASRAALRARLSFDYHFRTRAATPALSCPFRRVNGKIALLKGTRSLTRVPVDVVLTRQPARRQRCDRKCKCRGCSKRSRKLPSSPQRGQNEGLTLRGLGQQRMLALPGGTARPARGPRIRCQLAIGELISRRSSAPYRVVRLPMPIPPPPAVADRGGRSAAIRRCACSTSPPVDRPGRRHRGSFVERGRCAVRSSWALAP